MSLRLGHSQQAEISSLHSCITPVISQTQSPFFLVSSIILLTYILIELSEKWYFQNKRSESLMMNIALFFFHNLFIVWLSKEFKIENIFPQKISWNIDKTSISHYSMENLFLFCFSYIFLLFYNLETFRLLVFLFYRNRHRFLYFFISLSSHLICSINLKAYYL